MQGEKIDHQNLVHGQVDGAEQREAASEPKPKIPLARRSTQFAAFIAISVLVLLPTLWTFVEIENLPTKSSPAEKATILVDINIAEPRQFDLLPSVGPVLAHRIVEHREAHGDFKSVAELDRVQGIGAKTLEAIGRYCFVDASGGGGKKPKVASESPSGIHDSTANELSKIALKDSGDP